MGASVTRKEARKRKFAHVQQNWAESSPTKTTTTTNIVATDAADKLERAAKKAKKIAKAAKLSSPTPAAAIAIAIANNNGESEGKGEEDYVALSEQDHRPAGALQQQDDEGGEEEGEDDAPPSKQSRFVCFIGNLPFSATTASIGRHFEKVSPSAIRHSTSKDTGKSRGFAFLEFDGYDRMKTCLKLYHHSNFTAVDGDREGPRKINVELTAGGGGAKSSNRKAKLRAKNAKLNEERLRRAAEEEKNGGGGGGGSSSSSGGKKKQGGGRSRGREDGYGAESKKEKEGGVGPEEASDIHPSRRKQVSIR